MGSINEFWVKVQAQLEDTKFKKQMEQLSKKKYKVNVDVSNSGSKKATRDLEQLAYEATHTQTVFGKLKRSVGETFSGNKLAVTAYLAILKAIKGVASDAKTAIVDMDKAVTDLSVAQGQGRDTAANYLKQLNLQAQSIGATTKEVAQSADSWLRQGKSVKETGDLVYDSMILSKLGQIESAKASEYLTSALNGYKKSASEAIDIVDKLTAVDMESASDAGGLAESMSRTASAASMAGVSMDKLIGMISTVKEVTQASDESVGNMFKSVFSRMNQIKAGKFVDEETGESLNDTEKVLNAIGISMRDTNGQFLSSEKILDEVGSKWKSFDGVTQRAVATAMAGTYQYNKLISLFDNYSKALQYTEVSANSAGTAIDKFNNSYKESLEAKTNSLQAAFESMILDSDMDNVYSNIIKATTALIKFIDKTGVLKGALTGLTVTGGIKTFVTIKTGIQEAYIELNKFKNALDLVSKSKLSTIEYDRLLLLTNGLSNSQLKMIVSSQALTQAQRKQLLVASGLSSQEAELQLKTWGLSTANNGLTASTKSVSNAFSGLWTIIKAHPLVVLGTAVTAGVMIWQKYKQSVIDIKEAGETARSEFKSIQDEMNSTASKVNEVKDRYAELAQGVGNLGKATQNQGSLSNDDYEEFLNISNDLADLFPTLTNGYTDNGDAILDLNGDVQTITSSLNGLVEAQKAVAAQDMAKQMPDIFKSYRQDMNDDVKKYNEALEQQKKAQEAIAKLDDSNTGESYITYFDDLSEMMQKHQMDYDSWISQTGHNTTNVKLTSEEKEKFTQIYQDYYEQYQKTISDLETKIDNENKSFGQYVTQSLYSDATYQDFAKNNSVKQGIVDTIVSNLGYDDETADYGTDWDKMFKDKIQDDIINSIASIDDTRVVDAMNKVLNEDLSKADFDRYAQIIQDYDTDHTEVDFSSWFKPDDAEITKTAQEQKDRILSVFGDTREGDRRVLNNFIDSLTPDNLDILDKLSIDKQSTDQTAKEYVEYLKQKIEDYINSDELDASFKADPIDPLKDIKDSFSGFEDIYNEIVSGSSVAADAIEGLNEKFGELDGGTVLEDFKDTLTSMPGDISAGKEALNKLATAYIDNSDLIKNLTEDNADYVKSELEKIGVVNADEVVNSRLASSTDWLTQAQENQSAILSNLSTNINAATDAKRYSQLASIDLQNATLGDIASLINEANASGQDATALQNYAIQKVAANQSSIWTSGSIQNLAKLADSLEGTTRYMGLYQRMKNATSSQEAIEIEKELNHQVKVAISAKMASDAQVQYKAPSTVKSSNSDKTGSSTKKKTPLEKLQDWLSTLFDWIEIKLERQTDKISKYISKAESQLDDKKYSSSAKNYNNAIDATNVQVGYEETARDKYYTQASQILDKAVASKVISQKTADIIATRVADGSMNISEYSDEIREVISAYQEWYNKGKDASDALEELHKNIRTYIQDLKDVRDKQRDAKIDSITGYNDIATSTVANSARAKNSQLNASNSSLGKQNATYRDYVQNVTRDTNGVAASANGSVTNAIKGTKDAKYRTALLNAQKAIKNKTAVSDADLSTISAHSTYVYNRLYAYNVALDNAETARMEYATAYSSNYTDAIKNITEKYSNKDDATNDTMDLNSSKSDNAVTAKTKNKYLNKQASGYDTIAKNNQAEIDQYASSVKSARKTMNKSATATAYKGLGSKGQKAVSNVIEKARSQAKSKKPISASLISKITEYYKKGYISRPFYESCIRYNNARESLDQARKQAEIDKQTAITQKAELAQQKFSNISTEMDNKRHKYEQTATELNAKMSLYEERGNGASANWYVRLQKTEQKEYDSLIEKRKKQIKELDDSVANGSIKKGSTEWHDMKSQIDDTTNSINDAKKALAEYNNQILQVRWDRVDEYISKLQNLTTETDFVINELSRKDLTSDKTGGLTKEGNAVAGLHVSNYKVYQTEAKKYQSEIKKINKQLADDPYNQKLIAHKEELVKSYQDAIAGAQDEKYAVIDLIENGYASLKNHISDLIDQYNDLISSEKNAYDYANNISDKTQQIANIRKQLQAYSGDVSEEARAKVQELNVSLKDAEKDLKDTQFDQYVSATQDMLSDFQDDLDESIQNIIDTLDDKFKGLIDTINENWSSDNNVINKTLSTIGYSATKDGLKMYANGDITKNTTDAVNGVRIFLEKAWAKYDKTAHNSQTTSEKEKELKQKQEQIDALNQQIKALRKEKVTSKAQKQDVANRIKNLQDQIKELEGNKSGNSSGGTSAYGGGNGSENKSTSKTTSSGTDAGKKLSKSRVREIQNFINSSLINPAKGKKISDYDAFNQAIWKSYGGKTGKILSKEALQHLANLTGYAFSNKATSPFWQTLHKSGIKGFRRGSEGIPYDMIANLGEDGTELQYDVSKGVLKSVGQNDMIFTAEQAKTLMDFAKNPMMFSNMYTGNAFRMPNMPVTNRTDNNVSVTFNGGIHMDGVNDQQTFAKKLVDVYKNNTCNTRNMIKEDAIGSLSNRYNSLNVRKW
jgi:TP901 family phage tail tape measure protein